MSDDQSVPTPDRRPIHVVDVAAGADVTRLVNVVGEPPKKPGRVSLLSVNLAPALKKLDAVEQERAAIEAAEKEAARLKVHRPEESG